MNEEKILKAEKKMKNAVLLRLIFNVCLSLWMVSSYTDSYFNLRRVAAGNDNLPFVILFLFLDTALTILWLNKPVIEKIHFVTYIPTGVFYFGLMTENFDNEYSMGVLAVMIFIMPFLYIVGLIPFLIYNSGRQKIKNAMNENSNSHIQ